MRLVVCDNDPEALDLAVMDLRLEGHDVVGTALDGETALRLCDELRPDVLVVDHRMPPGPFGLDIARSLQAEGSPVSVIVYSNYQSLDLIREVRAAGAKYLPKGNLRALRRAVAGAER